MNTIGIAEAATAAEMQGFVLVLYTIGVINIQMVHLLPMYTIVQLPAGTRMIHMDAM